MSMDLDNAGGLAVAGLVAGSIEGAAARKDQHAEHASHCANCQAPLAGPFCGNCGQRAHLHRSLLHFGEELLHGILHFDAKAWRTLPMLVGKPGVLTRHYIDGQRVRFVSPLALFLFMIFFMFFVVSSLSKNVESGDVIKVSSKLSTKMQQKRASAEAKLAADRAAGKDTVDSEKAVSAIRQEVAEAELAAKTAAAEAAAASARAKFDGSINIDLSDKVEINTGMVAVDNALKHARDNPELALYKLKNAASKFSFLLVPISLPFLWLMFFWRRDITLYDHAVFSLYSLSFMAVLVSVIAVAFALGLSVVGGFLIVLAPPIHMYFQLRDSYGLSRMSTLWRTAALLFVAFTVFVIYLVIILTLSTH